MEMIDMLALWCGRIIFAMAGVVATAAVVGHGSNWAWKRVRYSHTFLRALQRHADEIKKPIWQVLREGSSKADMK